MILKSEIRNSRLEILNFKFVSRIAFHSLCLLVLVAPLTALAQAFVPLAPIPGLTDTNALSVAKSTNLASFFNNLYKFCIGLAAALAVIMIVWEGLRIATNQDNVSIITDSKGKIYNAIFGLVLVLAPVLVFSIINPSILNLSLRNLQPLNTATSAGGSVGAGGATGVPTGAVADTASGCSVTGTAGILQIALCPTSAAATTWGQSCTWGDLTSKEDIVNPSNGIPTFVRLCTGNKQPYRFIFTGSYSLKNYTAATTINLLRPLVSTTDRPQNAEDAAAFANICRGANLGFQTCVSDRPILTFAVSCGLTGASAPTTWKCYNERLSCDSGTLTKISDKCSSSPSWTPFQ